MSFNKLVLFWATVSLGLFHITTRCDARAVNVSNTWTMPQEGLNVFYRFFRDRISWFEADAVCQFHHANLVTVDNSFQFDATRDLLRELDVNDIVWIGLMRPQSSERFMWSNSRPLVIDTGYWAESLPLMDAPLCAVIDPIRDYRWHALRCGGPETASFLCEMPVPTWADACIIKDMPNLTMQYMADTASIELIRNCEEEGLIRQQCKGKQDRERAVRELICPRERMEAQRINEITNSHFKSLQIINNVRTDNNENNDIDLLPIGQASFNINGDFGGEQLQTEKNTVQRLIEQFNVDELMQADEPSSSSSSSSSSSLSSPSLSSSSSSPSLLSSTVAHENGAKISGEIPKTLKKKSTKKVINIEYPKKIKQQKSHEQEHIHEKMKEHEQEQEQLQQQIKQRKEPVFIPLEDLMMGDQPQGEPEMLENSRDEESSNEIIEPLPHKKKILPQDLKTMVSITERAPQVLASRSKHSSEEEESKESAESKEINGETPVFVDTTTAGIILKITTTPIPTTLTTTTTTTTTLPSTTLTTTTSVKTDTPTTDSTTTANLNIATTTATASSIASVTVTDIPNVITTEQTAADYEASTNPTTHNEHQTIHTQLTTISTTPTATIGHPMHPQQTRGNVISEETPHLHVKESTDNSHFIPPMLLVKSHYVPPPKHEHSAGMDHHHEHTFTHHDNYGTTTILDTSVVDNVKMDHSVLTATMTADTSATIQTFPQTADKMTTLTTENIVTLKKTDAPKTETTKKLTLIENDEITQHLQGIAKIIDDTVESANQANVANAKNQQQTNTATTSTAETAAIAVDGVTTILKSVLTETETENNETKNKNNHQINTQTTITTTDESKINKNVELKTDVVNADADGDADANIKETTLTTTTTTGAAATKVKPTEHVELPTAKIMERKLNNAHTEHTTPIQIQTTTTPKMIIDTSTLKTITAKSVKAIKTTANVKATSATSLIPQKMAQNTDATTTANVKVSKIKKDIAKTEPLHAEIQRQPKDKKYIIDAATDETLTAKTTRQQEHSEEEIVTNAITTANPSTVTVTNTDVILTDAPDITKETKTTIKSTKIIAKTTTTPKATTATTAETATTTTTLTPPPSPTPTRNFLKDETETPYKPNRRRSLTKPESVSYLKKILG